MVSLAGPVGTAYYRAARGCIRALSLDQRFSVRPSTRRAYASERHGLLTGRILDMFPYRTALHIMTEPAMPAAHANSETLSK